MTNDWHLAIDFGTSNTAAAHTTPGRGEVETLPLTHQGNLLPSAVYADESGALHVGYSALNHATARPDAFLASPKRAIELDTVNLAGRSIPTKSLVAAVLARVLDTARSQHNGTNPASITLTHPEAWSTAAITNLIDGARELGFDSSAIHTISEPRAAAWYYSRNHPVSDGDHVAVFDFGGGTLDIAVLEAKGGEFTVVSARGDNSLGGRNVDALIDRWVMEQLEEDEPDAAQYFRTASPRARAALNHSIQNAKEILSEASSATITAATPDGEINLLLTRDEFNSLLSTDIDRAVDLTRATLRDVASGEDVEIMYLTGGSSRIPYVQDRLGEVSRVARLDDPKTVVARGALFATLTTAGDLPSEANDASAADPFAAMGGAATGVGAGDAATAGTSPQQPTPPNSSAAHVHSSQPTPPPSASTAAASAASSTVPSSSKSSSSGSKVPLIIGGIVAAAVVVGGGFWAVNSMGGGSENAGGEETVASGESETTEETTSEASSTAETTSAESDTNAGTADGESVFPADLANLDTARSVVPAELQSKFSSCYLEERSTVDVWDVEASVADNHVATCRANEDDVSVRIVTDPATVSELQEAGTTSEYSFLDVEEAEGKNGAKIYMHYPSGEVSSTTGSWGVFYPDQDIALVAPFAPAENGKESIETFLTEAGAL